MINETIEETTLERINGKLYTIWLLKDTEGNVITKKVIPMKVEMTPQDVLQILAGAATLAIPASLTEEVWTLGTELSWLNITLMFLFEYFIIGGFMYFSAYEKHMKHYRWQYTSRILSTMLLSGLVIAVFLALADKLPLFTETEIALKRIIIGLLPASMSATLLDSLR